MPSGTDLMRGFLEHSPFARHLGFEVVELADDRAVLSMPFREEVVTIGDVVHGGAISSLIDTAATAAAWAGAEIDESNPRGTTVALTVNFLAAARAATVTATAEVARRGGTLCFCEVDVHAGNRLVAKGLVTYKLG
jgi:uncharacterized protein (TIGR00369 family)